MTNTNDIIDAITEAVTRRQIRHEPIPMLLVEGYCFLSDQPLNYKGSLWSLLESTVAEGATYKTSKSIVKRFEPDPDPISTEMDGPRFLFTRAEVAT